MIFFGCAVLHEKTAAAADTVTDTADTSTQITAAVAACKTLASKQA